MLFNPLLNVSSVWHYCMLDACRLELFWKMNTIKLQGFPEIHVEGLSWWWQSNTTRTTGGWEIRTQDVVLRFSMAMSLLASTNFLGCASRLSSSSASRLFSRTILYSSSIRGSTIATNQRAAKMPVVKAARTEAKQVELASRAPEFELVEPLTGKKWTLSEFQGHPALLVMFICNHCPFVVLLKAEIAKLTDEYMKRGLGAVAISSNSVKTHPQDGPEPMAKEAKQFGYQFPYLYDESQEVARAFGAVCTPEFFLYKKNTDNAFELVYHGQFDDARPGNGKPVTGSDLRSALDCVLSGMPLNTVQKPSMGCSIKWHPSS